MNKLILPLLMFAAQNSFAWVTQQGDLNQFVSNLNMSAGAQEQLSSFFNAQVPDYGNRLFQVYKGDLSRSLNGLTSDFQCRSQFYVQFNENLSQSQQASEREFESQLLRLESLDCLPGLDLQRVVTTYLSDSFQLKYINGLKFSQSDEKNNWVCQRTSVFPIGNSDYCARFHIWQNENMVVVFSLNEVNNNSPKAPVFFRAVTTVFKKMKDDSVLIYNLTYGRGPALPMHSIVKSLAAKQHKPFIEGLARESQ